MEIVGVVAPDHLGGDVGLAAARAVRLVCEGADLVDIDTIAGEALLDERGLARLVRRLLAEGVPVGVTTTSVDAVVSAVDAGARVVCDPSGGSLDPFMLRIVAAAGVRYVMGQSVARAPAARPATPAGFRDRAARRVGALLDAGLDPDQVVLDSGVGHYLRDDSRWDVLEHLELLARAGYPVLVDASWPALFAASRPEEDDGWAEEQDAAAVGVCVVAASANAWGVRVDDVARAAAVLRGPTGWSRHGTGTHAR